MGMGKDGKIDGGKVHSQHPGVAGKGVGFPRVQQPPHAAVLNIQGEPVLCAQAGLCTVFN